MRIMCLGEESDGGLMRLRWFGGSLMGIYCLGEESDGGLMYLDGLERVRWVYCVLGRSLIGIW